MARMMHIIVLVPLLALLCAAPASAQSPVDSAPCGTPTIVFDHVPAYDTYENLSGHVTCAAPEDYSIAVYIYVPQGWWPKPTFANALTTINSDGTWTTDVTTSSSDKLATDIAAFLIPDGYTPPRVEGSSVLPAQLYSSAAAHTSAHRAGRTICFSGYTWEVKNTPGKAGPGPNYFSNDPSNVWVDDNGYLHLKIVYRDGRWYCAEVISTATARYGQHTIVTGSRVDAIDQNAVMGFFTWDNDAPAYHYRELDIEFSRWGEAGDPNAQYVIQPWDGYGNRHRFDLTLNAAKSTHQINWLPDSVDFHSWDESGAELHSWTYTNAPGVPPEGGHIDLNLWLLENKTPENGESVEAIIRSYRFTPAFPGLPAYLPFVLFTAN